MRWMKEMSILCDVEDICKEKFKTKFNSKEPWKILEKHDEGTTEKYYRLRGAGKIENFKKTLQYRYK